MSYPVPVFGKHGPGEVRVEYPPPQVYRLPVLPRLPAVTAHGGWFISSDSVRVEYRTLRLRMYACPLPEHEEWAAWGVVRPVFQPDGERWLVLPVYVEEG